MAAAASDAMPEEIKAVGPSEGEGERRRSFSGHLGFMGRVTHLGGPRRLGRGPEGGRGTPEWSQRCAQSSKSIAF